MDAELRAAVIEWYLAAEQELEVLRRRAAAADRLRALAASASDSKVLEWAESERPYRLGGVGTPEMDFSRYPAARQALLAVGKALHDAEAA